MSNYKRKYCGKCNDSFHPQYFCNHKCVKDSSNSSDDSDNNIIEDETISNHTVQSDGADDDIQSDNSDLDEDDHIAEDLVDENEYEELLTDFQIDVDTRPDIVQYKNEFALASWLCLYLTLWQYTFGITDSSIELLLKFLKTLFTVLSDKYPMLKTLSLSIPPSLYLLHKKLGTDKEKFTKYVVCIKCKTLYKFENSFTKVQGINISKHCNHVINPNHRLKQYRKPCGQLLLMSVQSINGKNTLYPFKTYCYKSLKVSLQELINRNNFEESCESWRERKTEENVLSDVYDGKIWKKFSDPEHFDFFSKPRNYGLVVNLDWFAPFKHVASFSVGAIYLVMMNLPRCERFKRKNLILVGLIPNMNKEPPTNTFMQPLVDELQEGWQNGFELDSRANGKKTIYKVALICVGCDIPACRKLCGFLGSYNVSLLLVL